MGTDPSSSLRLRFAPDNGSVPKAPVSFEPPRVDRGVDPYNRAPARLRLTPPAFRLTPHAFAADNGSVPKAPISFEPPRVDRGVDPYRRAPARLRLTPHAFRLTSPASLRTMVQSPRLLFPLNHRGSTGASTPTTARQRGFASLLPLRSGQWFSPQGSCFL